MPRSTRRRTTVVAVGSLSLTLLGSAPALAAPDSVDIATGVNSTGQLGTGDTVSTVSPAPLLTPAGETFVDVSSYDGHTLALTADGELYAWGSNTSGQLGTGGGPDSASPVALGVPGVVFTDVAAGQGFSVAVGNGALWTWGSDADGRLGDGGGPGADVPTPTQLAVPGITFTGVAAGEAFAVALTDTGTAWAWGANASGQLGLGGTSPADVPTAPSSWPAGLVLDQVAAGEAFVVARSTAGGVHGWGDNGNGQLGDGTGSTDRDTVPAVPVAGVTADVVGAGWYHALAADSAGSAWAWGRDSDGALGAGGVTPSRPWVNPVPLPVVVPTGVSFVRLAGGGVHSAALGDDGRLYTWGLGAPGSLGTGGTATSYVPVPAATDPEAAFTALTAGSAWTIALGARIALSTVSGGDQSASVDSGFGTPIVVAVTVRGVGVAGRQVTFTASGATFPGGATSVTVTTGSDGRAAAPALVAGGTPGAASVTAAASGSSRSVAVPLTVTAAPPAPPAPPAAAPPVATAGPTPGTGPTPTVGPAPAGAAPAGSAVVAADPAALADTGVEVRPLLGGAVVTLLAGALALVAGRRRAAHRG